MAYATVENEPKIRLELSLDEALAVWRILNVAPMGETVDTLLELSGVRKEDIEGTGEISSEVWRALDNVLYELDITRPEAEPFS